MSVGAASLLEHTGSIPGSNLSATQSHWPTLAWLSNAQQRLTEPLRSGWGPGGRRFKSCLPDANPAPRREVRISGSSTLDSSGSNFYSSAVCRYKQAHAAEPDEPATARLETARSVVRRTGALRAGEVHGRDEHHAESACRELRSRPLALQARRPRFEPGTAHSTNCLQTRGDSFVRLRSASA